MNRFWIAALLLMVGPAWAENCIPRAEMEANIAPKVAAANGHVEELGLEKSQIFLSALNNIGERTSFSADRLFFVVVPEADKVWVFLDTAGCVDVRQVAIKLDTYYRLRGAIDGKGT